MILILGYWSTTSNYSERIKAAVICVGGLSAHYYNKEDGINEENYKEN